MTVGTLAVGSRAHRSFGVDEVETLASLANQAAIALEHDRLQARLRELAVVAERERIAREMHDGLAQVLGYVNTKSQAVDELLADGRVDEARAQLAELARRRPVRLRRRPRGDPRPAQPDRPRGRPRARRRGLRARGSPTPRSSPSRVAGARTRATAVARPGRSRRRSSGSSRRR